MKQFLIGVLFLCLVIPQMAFGGGYAGPSTDELLQRIEELSKELQRVKQQLKEVQTKQAEQQEEIADTVDDLSDKVDSVVVDGVGRFQVWGDYRFRLDSTRVEVAQYYNYAQIMQQMQNGQMPTMTTGRDYENDTIYTNRVRLNVKVKPSENLVFKGRIAAYKVWGMSTQEVTSGGGVFPANLLVNNFTYGIRPDDGRLYIDRAYVNWTNIGGLPVWFSVGRRPTTHTLPSQFREGLTKRQASPTGNIDLPFDGATIGYQYSVPFTGRIRFCYGRGFDSGFKGLGVDSQLDDTDFYGFVWDVVDDPDENLLFVIQAFKAADVMDFPEGFMFDPGSGQMGRVNTTANLGDIWELGTTWQHQYQGIDYFISLGWSITDPRGRSKGLTNPMTGQKMFEGVSLLTNPGQKLSEKTGWSIYVGTRIPFEQYHTKLGFEYNYGSKYWMPFLQASDDVYMDKRATRGHVGEVYLIWDLPETPLSKYAKSFIRAGYQYYWFNYTGSGMWLGKPIAISELDDSPMNAQMFPPVDHMSNAYLTFEVYF